VRVPPNSRDWKGRRGSQRASQLHGINRRPRATNLADCATISALFEIVNPVSKGASDERIGTSVFVDRTGMRTTFTRPLRNAVSASSSRMGSSLLHLQHGPNPDRKNILSALRMRRRHCPRILHGLVNAPTTGQVPPQPLPSLYRTKNRVRPREGIKACNVSDLILFSRPQKAEAVKGGAASRIVAHLRRCIRNTDPTRTERIFFDVQASPSKFA
jgi:hypothetical protein